MEAFLNRYTGYTLTPVSHYSSATLDGHWHQRAQEYYNTRSCLVLQNLFPDDFKVKPRWLHETGWDSIFPAVAAHIIPKNGYNFVQNELSIEIDSPRNSILLLRHLEHTFQDGDWSLIPAERSSGAVNFKIYVSQNLKDMNVNYIDENGDSSEAVRVRKGQALQPLKFGDLHEHERDFWVEPPPFLRALFLKARMAWQKHKEDDDPLPDPAQFADTFSDFCDTWSDFMVGKFLSSIRQLNSAGGTQSPWFWKHLQKTVSQTGWMEKNSVLLPQEDLSSKLWKVVLLRNFPRQLQQSKFYLNTKYQWYPATSTHISMTPRTKYQRYAEPSINDNQIPVSKYQWYPDTRIQVRTTIPRRKYQWYHDTNIQVSVIPKIEYQWYPDTSIQLGVIPERNCQNKRWDVGARVARPHDLFLWHKHRSPWRH